MGEVGKKSKIWENIHMYTYVSLHVWMCSVVNGMCITWYDMI